jgi:prophage regulatory protein
MTNSTNKKILRLNEVMAQTGLSRSNIYLQMSEDRFPKSINIGLRSVGWLEHEIDEWIEIQVSKR